MFFGKPMIVLPLFADQPDNGQRVKEKGFGYRFHPYHVTEVELLEAIENILGDESLKSKLEKISKEIQKSNSVTRAAETVEKAARMK